MSIAFPKVRDRAANVLIVRAIKDGSFMDVIEIDAASNNGVENIRELRESVKYPPAIGRKKGLYHRRGSYAFYRSVLMLF